MEAVPTGMATMREGSVLFPAGKAFLPAGIASIPGRIATIPIGIASIPTGIIIFPAGMAAIPPGKTAFPAGKGAIPAGKYRNQLKISNLLFYRCRRQGDRRGRRGRIGGAMLPHLAADVLEFFGLGRAFAQQAGHRINHAAGVVIRAVAGGVQIGSGLDVGHFILFLDWRERVDRPQLRLQPGDVRQHVEIFRLQRRLIVGILHIGDGLSDDADFFSECVHGELLIFV